MGFLDKFKKNTAGAANKFTGRLDGLQAVCAAAALSAAADGEVADKELDKAVASINSIDLLKQAFPQSEIDSTLDGMLTRAKGGRMGQRGLYKEIEEIKGDELFAEACVLVSLDVADDNGIGEQEREVCTKIAVAAGLDIKKFL